MQTSLQYSINRNTNQLTPNNNNEIVTVRIEPNAANFWRRIPANPSLNEYSMLIERFLLLLSLQGNNQESLGGV